MSTVTFKSNEDLYAALLLIAQQLGVDISPPVDGVCILPIPDPKITVSSKKSNEDVYAVLLLILQALESGGGGDYFAANGIYLDGDTFKLGQNPLIENTTITADGNTFKVSNEVNDDFSEFTVTPSGSSMSVSTNSGNIVNRSISANGVSDSFDDGQNNYSEEFSVDTKNTEITDENQNTNSEINTAIQETKTLDSASGSNVEVKQAGFRQEIITQGTFTGTTISASGVNQINVQNSQDSTEADISVSNNQIQISNTKDLEYDVSYYMANGFDELEAEDFQDEEKTIINRSSGGLSVTTNSTSDITQRASLLVNRDRSYLGIGEVSGSDPFEMGINFDRDTNKTTFNDNRTVKRGIEYSFQDYSGLTNDSLIPLGALYEFNPVVFEMFKLVMAEGTTNLNSGDIRTGSIQLTKSVLTSVHIRQSAITQGDYNAILRIAVSDDQGNIIFQTSKMIMPNSPQQVHIVPITANISYNGTHYVSWGLNDQTGGGTFQTNVVNSSLSNDSDIGSQFNVASGALPDPIPLNNTNNQALYSKLHN